MKRDSPPQRTTLLLVDDDQAVRQALTRALNSSGAFSVIPAAHGRQALDILDQEPVGAILTDLQMPVMDGVTFLGRLLERERQPPVAVMTGMQVSRELRARLEECGIAGIFSKPLEMTVLADELQRCVAPRTVDRVSSVTLPGLLQLLELEQRSVLVAVHPERGTTAAGRLWFEEGVMVHAEAPQLDGVPAFYEILGWSDPTVEIFHERRTGERTVQMPLRHLLMEDARLKDERRRPSAPAVTRPAEVIQSAVVPGRSSQEHALLFSLVEEALDIPGAVAAALVRDGADLIVALSDSRSGAVPQAKFAAAAEEMVAAQRTALAALGNPEPLQDVVITAGTQYYVLRPVTARRGAFLLLLLDRARASVELARVQLGGIAGRLTHATR